MTEHFIERRYAEFSNVRKEQQPARIGIRIYRSSPNTVTLQIWGEKRYATVMLDYSEVSRIIDALTEEACFEPMSTREFLDLVRNHDQDNTK